MEYAEDFLPKYYLLYIHDWNKVTSVERSYRNVVVEGVPISGKLDKLEFDGNLVNVVDYKTGQFKNATKKFNRPDKEKVEDAKEKGKPISFEDEHGGDYWRQAVFYKLLLDYDKGKNWEMKSAEFDFVEPDKTSGEYLKQHVTITHEDMIVVKNQILASYKSIMNKEFEVGCMKDDCRWCNFMGGYASARNTNPDIANETDETANA
jgi:DNA helicase-2/ATP-dependent DNA helicase PcrA